MAAINSATRGTGFSCRTVSWEDAQRGHTASGGLSSYGPNIADVRLYEKSGTLLYTLRSENWNERLGYVNSTDVMLMTGNEDASGVLKTVSLADYLRHANTFGSYAGLQTANLFADGVDELFSIRFQAVFLPTASGTRPTTEFCTEVYSYQTRNASDPRNMLLLATPQGTSMTEDTPGRQKLFFHSFDASTGQTPCFWLEAERSTHQVGGAQAESQAEVVEAAARGKAVAVRIGPAAMGTRFNVQMLIQVPLQQKWPSGGFGGSVYGSTFGGMAPSMDMCSASGFGSPILMGSCARRSNSGGRGFGGNSFTAGRGRGVSNAARVSRGSREGTFAGLACKDPARERSQHGTITVTLYYTVQGGVPSVEDVQRCVADLDALYKAMPSDKRLSACNEVLAGPATQFNPAVPVNIFANTGSVPPVPTPVFPSSTSTVNRDLHPTAVPPANGQSINKVFASAAFARPPTLLCPLGHALSNRATGFGCSPYFCDVCGRSKSIAPRMGCAACDFDVCVQCFNNTKAPCFDSAPLVPHDGRSSGVAVCVRCSLCQDDVLVPAGLVFVRPRDRLAFPQNLSTAVCLSCYTNGAPLS